MRKKSNAPLGGKIAETLAVYARTQLLVLAVVTGVTWGILTLLGVRFALILGFVTGALSVVPFFGIVIAAVITGMVAIVDGSRFLPSLHPVFEALAIFVIFFLINQLMDFFLTPYLLSRASKVHPLLILIAVLLGTSLFGIVGTILAVPVLLIAKTIANHFTEKTE